jgi:uncharacterized membrane protein
MADRFLAGGSVARMTLLAGAALLCAGVAHRGFADDAPVSFADVQRIVETRCRTCHSESPLQQDVYEAPKGIKLDDAQEIKFYSPKIMEQVVKLRLMPLSNITEITEEERTKIGRWIADGANID